MLNSSLAGWNQEVTWIEWFPEPYYIIEFPIQYFLSWEWGYLGTWTGIQNHCLSKRIKSKFDWFGLVQVWEFSFLLFLSKIYNISVGMIVEKNNFSSSKPWRELCISFRNIFINNVFPKFRKPALTILWSCHDHLVVITVLIFYLCSAIECADLKCL